MTCNTFPQVSTVLKDSCSIFSDYGTLKQNCITCNNDGIFSPDSYFSNLGVPGSCINFLNSVNTSDLDQYTLIRQYMNFFFEEFNKRNCKITDNISDFSRSFLQDNLYFVCKNYGGFCDLGLNSTENTFRGICSNLKKSELSNKVQLSHFCGCHLDISEYVSNYDFSCDSICLSNQSLKKYTPTNSIINCNQNLCIISDISINILESEGNLNFSQLCGNSCVGGQCSLCIMQDVNINTFESKIDTNIFGSCGRSTQEDLSGFVCYETDQNTGEIVEIECKYTTEEEKKTNTTVFILLGVGVFIVLSIFIGILILIFSSSKGKSKSKNTEIINI